MVFPLRKIVDFAMLRPDEVDKAYGEFFGALPFTELEQQWEELFTEWLIFDFKSKKGTTFLIEYFLRNPEGLNEKTLEQFEQISKTHLYSQFEINQIKRGEWIRVEDLFTGKNYKIYEKKGSETLPGKGVIPGRIAKVDDKWYLVGANSIFFPITYTERAKRNMRTLTMKNFSPKDTVELLRAQKESPPEKIKIPTKKELKEKRKNLKERYEKLSKNFGVKLLFEDLISTIYKENRANVLDFWKNLEKRGLKAEALVEDLDLFQDIWNYFPHKCLNDLSPIEVFTKFQKEI